MNFCIRHIGVVVATAAVMSSCSARESLGTLTASIGGTPYQGITMGAPTDSSATADFTTIGGMTMISIQAHDPDASSIMENVLSLDLTLQGTDASAALADSGLSYWPDGLTAAYYTTEQSGNNVDIAWEILRLGEDAFAQGSFSAELCRQESMFSEIDTSDCVAVEGTFETALRRSVIEMP